LKSQAAQDETDQEDRSGGVAGSCASELKKKVVVWKDERKIKDESFNL